MAWAGIWNGGSVRRDAALIPVRLALGSTMLYHGASKLRGDGPRHTAQMFEQIGIRPAKTWAVATGLAETFAGVAAILGVATRPAALAVLVTQAIAIKKVHAPKGFATYRGGYEFNLGLMATAVAMLLGGPGRYSLSSLLRRATAPRGLRRYVPGRRPRGLLGTLLAAVG